MATRVARRRSVTADLGRGAGWTSDGAPGRLPAGPLFRPGRAVVPPARVSCPCCRRAGRRARRGPTRISDVPPVPLLPPGPGRTRQARRRAAEALEATHRAANPAARDLALRSEHVHDLGQERSEHRKQLTGGDARTGCQLLDRLRSERLADRGRLDGLVLAGRDSRVDLVAEAPSAELVEDPVDAAGGLGAAGRARRARPSQPVFQAGWVPGVALVAGVVGSLMSENLLRSCRPGRRLGGRALGGRALGRLGLLGRVQRPVPGVQALEQPSAGEVEVDRRHRDAPVDDGVEVGPRDGQARRRRSADPEVGDPARVQALDQLVLVDALAQAGDLDAVALLER